MNELGEQGLGFDGKIFSLRNKRNGERVIKIDNLAFKYLCDELWRRFDSGAIVILLDMGKSYGRHLSEDAKLVFDELDYLRYFKKTGLDFGWGNFVLESHHQEDRIMTARIFDCAFSPIGSNSTDQSRRYFMMGVILGFFDGCLGGTWRAKHAQCACNRTGHCEILLERD